VALRIGDRNFQPNEMQRLRIAQRTRSQRTLGLAPPCFRFRKNAPNLTFFVVSAIESFW
jgi:hypothetical protein